MAELPLRIVDAFTEEAFQGNRAGVVLDAGELGDAACLAIAREVNASETAFVEECAGGAVRVRFFTIQGPVPLCGHATLATFLVLAEERRIAIGPDGVGRASMECDAGRLPIEMRHAGGSWRVRQRHVAPRVEHVPIGREEAAALHGLGAESVRADLPIEFVSTGLRFMMIPLRDAEALARAAPAKELRAFQQKYHLDGTTLFALDAPAGAAAEVRVFCDALGVAEDPATGTNATALGCYFFAHGLAKASRGVARMMFLQGRHTGRRCKLSVEVHAAQGGVEAAFVEGAGVVTVAGTMRVPG